MGIYGHKFDCLTEAQNINIEEFKDSLIEVYSSIIDDMSINENVEIVEEGVNIDLGTELKKSKKEVKEHLKKYKSYMKNKNFKKASEELEYANNILKESKKKMENMDADSAGSAVLGLFASLGLSICELTIPFTMNAVGIGATAYGFSQVITNNGKPLLPPISKIAGKTGIVISTLGTIVMIIQGIVVLYKDIKKWIEEFEKDDKKLETKHFNLYRNKLLRMVDDEIKEIDKLKETVNKTKIKDNPDEVDKETRKERFA